MAGATTTTSMSQDASFLKELVNQFGIQEGTDFTWVLDWVAENVDPSEIYDEKKLDEWARENDYIKKDECEEG